MFILIIEDEKDLSDILEKTLQKLGHRVLTFSEGVEAFDYIRKAAEKKMPLDLLITDLNLPGMDGTEIINKIRDEFDWDLPIVVSSGFVNDFVRKELEELGNIAVLTKPIKREEIISIIESLS